MSSTAIILHTLTDRGEINRTHGRLAFSMLLFQDIAFVPLLALASALPALSAATSRGHGGGGRGRWCGRGGRGPGGRPLARCGRCFTRCAQPAA